MKKLLLVTNTLGRAGAEIALMEFLNKLDQEEYDVSLYVILGQGELIDRLPSYVKVLNATYSSLPVHTKRGRRRIKKTCIKALFRKGYWIGRLGYLIKIFSAMIKNGNVRPDKLLWRVLSDGAQRFDETFDLAIAWLEGGSAYYVAEHVKAKRKAAFVHIAYGNAGYTRAMDQDCWNQFDRIFAVSDEVKEHFADFYPEYAGKIAVFHNIIDRDAICRKSMEKGGFEDGYEGMRILTVGRLTHQKGYDIAVEAMKLLKKSGCQARWYILGEGEKRRKLEKKIVALDLKEDFRLMGAVENPYPYYRQADVYVHATRFEGKSLVIQEAQILGCAIIVSDCNGNREQVVHQEDGILCELTPASIAEAISALLADREKREALGRAAKQKFISEEDEMPLLTELLA